jgi:hypothetical protein
MIATIVAGGLKAVVCGGGLVLGGLWMRRS